MARSRHIRCGFGWEFFRSPVCAKTIQSWCAFIHEVVHPSCALLYQHGTAAHECSCMREVCISMCMYESGSEEEKVDLLRKKYKLRGKTERIDEDRLIGLEMKGDGIR